MILIGPTLWLTLPALALFGAFGAQLTIWAQTLRMQIIQERLRGRAFALLRGSTVQAESSGWRPGRSAHAGVRAAHDDRVVSTAGRYMPTWRPGAAFGRCARPGPENDRLPERTIAKRTQHHPLIQSRGCCFILPRVDRGNDDSVMRHRSQPTDGVLLPLSRSAQLFTF